MKKFLTLAAAALFLTLSAQAASVALSSEPVASSLSTNDDLWVNATNSGAGTWTTKRGTVGTVGKALFADPTFGRGLGTNAQMAASIGTNASLNLGWFDAKRDFGAVGDGAADDTTALQNAFAFLTNSASAQGWRRLRIPAGKYKVTGTLKMPNVTSATGWFPTSGGVEIYGDGPGATVLNFTSTTIPGVQLDAVAQNCGPLLRSMTIQGPGVASYGSGQAGCVGVVSGDSTLATYRNFGPRLRDLLITGWYGGVGFTNDWRVQITGCLFQSNSWWAVALNTCFYSTLREFEIQGIQRYQNLAMGIVFDGNGGVCHSIEDGMIWAATNAVIVNDGAVVSQNVALQDCGSYYTVLGTGTLKVVGGDISDLFQYGADPVQSWWAITNGWPGKININSFTAWGTELDGTWGEIETARPWFSEVAYAGVDFCAPSMRLHKSGGTDTVSCIWQGTNLVYIPCVSTVRSPAFIGGTSIRDVWAGYSGLVIKAPQTLSMGCNADPFANRSVQTLNSPKTADIFVPAFSDPDNSWSVPLLGYSDAGYGATLRIGYSPINAGQSLQSINFATSYTSNTAPAYRWIIDKSGVLSAQQPTNNLSMNGAQILNGIFWNCDATLTTNRVIAQSANYSLSTTDTVVKVTGNHTITMTAPGQNGVIGKLFGIMCSTAGTNAILPNGAETFLGPNNATAAKWTNSAVGRSTWLMSDGANWVIVKTDN